MQTIVRVGVDLAKNVLQVHAVDAQGRMVSNRAIQRSKFLAWCAQLPAECLVGMEAAPLVSAVAAHGLGFQSSKAYCACISCVKGSKRNAQHALTAFEDCSPSSALCCRKAPEPQSLTPICTISWKMPAMTSQARPALRCSVHSCIGKSSMNIFTGVSSVLPLTVKKMHRCSELCRHQGLGATHCISDGRHCGRLQAV